MDGPSSRGNSGRRPILQRLLYRWIYHDATSTALVKSRLVERALSHRYLFSTTVASFDAFADVLRGNRRVRRWHTGHGVAIGEGRGRVSNVDGVFGARHAKDHDAEMHGNPSDATGVRRPYQQTKLVAFEEPSHSLRTKYHHQRTSTSNVSVRGQIRPRK